MLLGKVFVDQNNSELAAGSPIYLRWRPVRPYYPNKACIIAIIQAFRGL